MQMFSLPKSISTQYLGMQQQASKLKAAITQTETQVAIAVHADLQTQFQAMLATLSLQHRQQLQHYNTEIFKEIQILGSGLMRLNVLKTGEKQRQLQVSLGERCDRLQHFFMTLLDCDSPS